MHLANNLKEGEMTRNATFITIVPASMLCSNSLLKQDKIRHSSSLHSVVTATALLGLAWSVSYGGPCQLMLL